MALKFLTKKKTQNNKILNKNQASVLKETRTDDKH